MSHFAALEVVIGLSFVYFLFALICSGVTEWIATSLDWRARMLETAIENMFSGKETIDEKGQALAKKFWAHPLIQALSRPKNVKLLKPRDAQAAQAPAEADAGGRTPRPSYIPS